MASLTGRHAEMHTQAMNKITLAAQHPAKDRRNEFAADARRIVTELMGELLDDLGQVEGVNERMAKHLEKADLPAFEKFPIVKRG